MLVRRWHRRPLVRWSLAAALALTTAAAVRAEAHRAEAARRAWGNEQRVAVATRALPAGTVIAPGDVEVRSWPAGLVPSGALDRTPVGDTVRAAIARGEAVLADRLGRHGATGAADLVPDGWRALAVPTTSSSLAVADGSVVDLYATSDPTGGAGGGPTGLVAEGALVVAHDDHEVTVAVPVAAAAAVAHAVATGVVTMALAP